MVIVVAPAGAGAREGLFVLLLTPLIGVGDAVALSLLARVVHTVADGVMAAGWWYAVQLHPHTDSTAQPAARSA